MRIQTAVAWLIVGQGVLAASIAKRPVLSEKQFVESLLKNPQIVPSRCMFVVHPLVIVRTILILIAYRVIEQMYSTSQNPPNKPPAATKPSTSSGLAGLVDSISTGLSILSALPSVLANGGTSGGDLSKAPKPTVPDLQITKSPLWPEAERVKVRYGPFRMIPKSEKNLNWMVWNMEGATTTLKYNVKKPCSYECTILSISADLEYFDGSSANVTNEVRHCSAEFQRSLLTFSRRHSSTTQFYSILDQTL